MPGQIIVMTASGHFDLRPVSAAASSFGWTVQTVPNLMAAVDAAVQGGDAVAILVDREAIGQQFSWPEAIRLLHMTLPEVPVVPCLSFSEHVDWDGLAEAGAFHSLRFPLDGTEVRQSMGFLADARKRADEAASRRLVTPGLPMPETITVRPAARARAATSRHHHPVRSSAASGNS